MLRLREFSHNHLASGLSWLAKLIQRGNPAVFIVILGTVLRLAWVLTVPTVPESDAIHYYQTGLEISRGLGYINNDGSPTAYWPVGYSGFLGLLFSIFGQSLIIAKLANVFLSAGIIWFSYLCANFLFDKRVALIAGFVLAVYPNYIFYSSLLLSEILMLFLIMLGTWLLISRHIWGAAIIFGLATLVKPQVVFLPILLFLILFRSRYPLKVFMTFYAILILTLIPWTFRNYQTFGSVFFVSTNGGVNLLIGNNPYATGGYFFDHRVSSLVQGATEIERDQSAKTEAIRFATKHPLDIVAKVPDKLIAQYLLGNDGVAWNKSGLKNVPLLVIFLKVLTQCCYLALMIAALVNGFRSIRRNCVANTLIGSIVLYFTLITILFFGATRFNFPIIPWIAMISARRRNLNHP